MRSPDSGVALFPIMGYNKNTIHFIPVFVRDEIPASRQIVCKQNAWGLLRNHVVWRNVL
ncbi:hypothetical protein HMPREF1141_1452 [Clostridium sp. MSTE9]|nr:hypothetical protein HMPREF1141_1452 [Clostridium sp. MSTE9]